MPPDSHPTVARVADAPMVPARMVLAANIQRLRRAVTPPMSFEALERATAMKGHRIGRTTLHRATTGGTALTLDNLEAIAKVFNLAPWQLLVPNLKPGTSPRLAVDADHAHRAMALQLVTVARELSPDTMSVYSTAPPEEEDPWTKSPI